MHWFNLDISELDLAVQFMMDTCAHITACVKLNRQKETRNK